MSRWPGRGGLNSDVAPVSEVKDLAGSTGPEAFVCGPIPTTVSPREAIRSRSKESVITLYNISIEFRQGYYNMCRSFLLGYKAYRASGS